MRFLRAGAEIDFWGGGGLKAKIFKKKLWFSGSINVVVATREIPFSDEWTMNKAVAFVID